MAGLGLLLFVAFVVALAVQVWALVDAARRPEEHLAQRGGKTLWVVLLAVFLVVPGGFLLGSCTWWPYDLAECEPIWASGYPRRVPWAANGTSSWCAADSFDFARRMASTTSNMTSRRGRGAVGSSSRTPFTMPTTPPTSTRVPSTITIQAAARSMAGG